MERFNLSFKELPGYATFLLEKKLEQYAVKQLQVAREIKFPLLHFFEHMGDDELINLSKISLTEFFQYIISNNAAGQIKESLTQWKNNRLPLINKEQIVADDISLTGVLRKICFTEFLAEYTPQVSQAIAILRELDTFNAAVELESYRVFLTIQLDKIEEGYKALAERDKLYKQSQALTHIGNWTWMVSGEITWSDELYRIYGLEPQSEVLTFERFIGLVHPDDRQNRIEQIQKAIETLHSPDYTMRIVTDKGETKVLQGKNEVLVNEEGKAIGIAGTCQDITAEYYLRQQLEKEKANLDIANKELEKKNAELERSNSELSSFSYIASHDLQEPLRKIKTFSSIMQEDAANLPGNISVLLSKIDTSVLRMQTLIRDLLAFSQMHNQVPKFENVDLHKLMVDIVASFVETPGGKTIQVQMDNLPEIEGIAFQLTQLFSNIISNSIKYSTDNNVEVKVSYSTVVGEPNNAEGLKPGKEYGVISIRDNGIGFNPEYKEKIFEMFQRLHAKSEYSGTGIGLAICKKIVQNHHGAITAVSALGEGATFNVYLPLRHASAPVETNSLGEEVQVRS